MYEAKGLYNEALKAFGDALNIEPGHVLSLISTAVVLKRCSNESNPAVRSFLMDALRHDRLNASAWYNLGLYHKAEGTVSSLVEATECFQAAQSLEESTPLEPFR
jgi:tetratricopeptide (TPR) repeat protein